MTKLEHLEQLLEKYSQYDCTLSEGLKYCPLIGTFHRAINADSWMKYDIRDTGPWFETNVYLGVETEKELPECDNTRWVHNGYALNWFLL